jgi:hypothetical protein
MSDDREVVEDRVVSLKDVVHGDCADDDEYRQ